MSSTFKIQKFLNRFSLCTGVICVAVLNLIAAIGMLVYIIPPPTYKECFNSYRAEIIKQEERKLIRPLQSGELMKVEELAEKGCNVVRIVQYTGISLCSLGILISVLLVFGALKNKSICLLIWLVFNAVTMILFFIFAARVTILHINVGIEATLIVFFCLIIAIIYVYAWRVTYSLHVDLKNGSTSCKQATKQQRP